MLELSNDDHHQVGGTFLPCTAVLFDSDGVLVDSETIILDSWRKWADKMGEDPDEVLTNIHGRRAQDTVARFVEPRHRKEALALIDSMEIEDASKTHPIPGAAELLNSIPKERWAIFTSASPELALARLTAAGIPVPKVLVTGGDVTHGKPHPEGYLRAARSLGVKPEECVVVEDAVPGIRAARAAKVGAVLGVGSFNADEGEPNATVTGATMTDAAVPDVTVPDLRYVRWTGSGLEVTPPGP